jgi:prepilin-type N-terminal cleavage/methylation domain-containing protein/prepilin-type processing-associated H-X9-DG protein
MTARRRRVRTRPPAVAFAPAEETPMICRRRRFAPVGRRAFTLIELLVVVGIIAVLAGFLFPALRRVRDQASSATCASNLSQIDKAFLMYAQEYGRFPYHADWGMPHPEDWIHWQPGQGRDPANPLKSSAIAKYLGNFNPSLFRCPADDVTNRRKFDGKKTGPVRYEFSYTMNGLFASYQPGSVPAGFGNVRLIAVQNPGGKVIVLEEDPLSIDDGHFLPYSADPRYFNGQDENLLSSVHTRPRFTKLSDFQGPQPDGRKDKNERGNVAFADGHVELVTRYFTWSEKSMDPKKP